MEEGTKAQLAQFTMMARAVVENAERMKSFLPMMDSPEGAIQAVQSVIGAIEQKKPIPPRVVPLLGVNCYMLMVDMAHNATGEEPDPQIVRQVAMEILSTFSQSHAAAPEPAAEPAPEQMQEQQAGMEQPAGGGLIGRAMGA